MSEIAIRVQNLGKRYRLGGQQERYPTLRDSLVNAMAAPLRRLTHLQSNKHASQLFWALKNVSLDIEQGEVVGIIGRNGAGKSTLLKILSHITEPTEGKVELYGRVGSLLEVGTGFHPELTGRENIYLNGAILGMRRVEIERKFDEIVLFAEIEKFLDTPVKRYSSGMYVRLAFAVAAHLEPEILLVDEVLSVGDISFQQKCLGKMEEVSKEGRTVLFVSHNMGAISNLCKKSIWLDNGRIKEFSETKSVINSYTSVTYENQPVRQFEVKPDAIAQIISVRLLDDNGNENSNFPSGCEPTFEITFFLKNRIRRCYIYCVVKTVDGYHLFSSADTDTNTDLFDERNPGRYITRVRLPTKLFNIGTYHVIAGIAVFEGDILDRQESLSFTIHDTGDFGSLKERSRRAGLLLAEIPWKYQ